MIRITETITPEKAWELLKTGKRGGALFKLKVNTFKNKMLSGKWIRDNGAFIYIRQGKLVNGHHRLEAVADSGLTLEMRIQYDN
jgi:hypothetical protein